MTIVRVYRPRLGPKPTWSGQHLRPGEGQHPEAQAALIGSLGHGDTHAWPAPAGSPTESKGCKRCHPCLTQCACWRSPDR